MVKLLMSWLFKDKKEVPKQAISQLPELPELPPISENAFNLNSFQKPTYSALPAFPEKAGNEKINNQIVKDIVKSKEKPETLPKLPETEEKMTKEIEENEKIDYLQSKKIEIPKIQENIPQKKIQTNSEPLFIRIDKYKDSIENLEEAKRKVLEIEEVLRNIREVRTREEAELTRWENEIKEAKSRLDNIDRTIFQNLD